MGSLRSKHKANLICGLVYLALAIGVAVHAQTIPVGELNFGAMNARSFPTICAGVIALLSLCLIWQAVRGIKHSPKPTEEELAAERAGRKRLVDVLLAVILVALDIALLKPLGYLVVTPVFLFALIMLVTPKIVRKPVKFAVISIVVTIITYVIFRYAFSVQLPLGILG